MNAKPYPLSDTPYAWGHEHFCAPDATVLYDAEPDRVDDVGEPVKLPGNPVPPTFCSSCLQWFDDPQHLTAASHLPPEQGETHA